MTTSERTKAPRISPILVGMLALTAAFFASDGRLPRTRPPGPPPPAPRVLEVLVVARSDSHPIGGALVRVDSPPLEARTSDRGIVRFELVPAAGAEVRVTAAGYARTRGPLPALRENERLRVELDPSRTLAGRVVDDHDQPLRGARISAIPDDDPDEPPIEVDVADDGTFLLDHLTAGRWVVRAEAPGHESVARLVVLGESVAPEERFVLLPTGSLEIEVVDARGAPAADAEVTVGGIVLTAPRVVRTGADGRVVLSDLPRGLYEARATLGTSTSARASALDVEPSRATRARLALEEGAAVEGRVLDAGGAPLAGVEIAISEDALDLVPRLARTDADGRFRLPAIRRRPHVLVARLEGFLPYGPAIFVGGEPLPTLVLTRAATIRGRIVDAHGDPVVGAVVVMIDERGPVALGTEPPSPAPTGTAAPALPLAPAANSGATTPMLQAAGELGVTLGDIPPIPLGTIAATPAVAAPASRAATTLGSVTDRNGVYVLVGVPPGTVQLTAHHPAHPSVTSEPRAVASGATIDGWNLVFPPSGTLTASVVDARNRPVVGVPVELRTDADDVPRSGLTGFDGRITFEGVSGIAVVTAMPTGRPAGRARAEVAPGGSAEVVVTLDDALASLEGRVVDARNAPVELARVTVSSLQRRTVFETFTMTEPDGTFRLDALPPPPYRITVDHPRFAEKRLDEVRPPRDGRLTITLEVGGTIVGTIVDEDDHRAIERAIVGLYDGDELVDEDATDGSGRFEFVRITPGRFRLRAREREHLPLERTITLATSRYDEPRLDAGRLEMLGAFVIRGRVVDALGDPVERARVSLPGTLGFEPIATGPGGTFELRGVAPGTHEIQAEHVRAGTARGRRPVRGTAREIVSDVEIRLPGRRAADERTLDAALVRGVPVVLDSRDTDLFLAWVAPASIAESAGLRVDDVVVSIDGEPAVELVRAGTLLRGPLTVPVDLVIRRGGRERRVRVGREIYRPPPDELVLRR